jgi:hypothetical protein
VGALLSQQAGNVAGGKQEERGGNTQDEEETKEEQNDEEEQNKGGEQEEQEERGEENNNPDRQDTQLFPSSESPSTPIKQQQEQQQQEQQEEHCLMSPCDSAPGNHAVASTGTRSCNLFGPQAKAEKWLRIVRQDHDNTTDPSSSTSGARASTKVLVDEAVAGRVLLGSSGGCPSATAAAVATEAAPVGLVSIFGLARQGKSSLMNHLAGVEQLFPGE